MESTSSASIIKTYFLWPKKEAKQTLIPKEILLHILSYCSYKEWVALCRTCKRWKQITEDETARFLIKQRYLRRKDCPPGGWKLLSLWLTSARKLWNGDFKNCTPSPPVNVAGMIVNAPPLLSSTYLVKVEDKDRWRDSCSNRLKTNQLTVTPTLNPLGYANQFCSQQGTVTLTVGDKICLNAQLPNGQTQTLITQKGLDIISMVAVPPRDNVPGYLFVSLNRRPYLTVFNTETWKPQKTHFTLRRSPLVALLPAERCDYIFVIQKKNYYTKQGKPSSRSAHLFRLCAPIEETWYDAYQSRTASKSISLLTEPVRYFDFLIWLMKDDGANEATTCAWYPVCFNVYTEQLTFGWAWEVDTVETMQPYTDEMGIPYLGKVTCTEHPQSWTYRTLSFDPNITPSLPPYWENAETKPPPKKKQKQEH